MPARVNADRTRAILGSPNSAHCSKIRTGVKSRVEATLRRGFNLPKPVRRINAVTETQTFQSADAVVPHALQAHRAGSRRVSSMPSAPPAIPRVSFLRLLQRPAGARNQEEVGRVL